MATPIRTADGRVVAVIDGEALFKKVDSKKHMLRKPPSWAFDRATIEEAQDAGATRIEVWASDKGITYTATMRISCSTLLPLTEAIIHNWRCLCDTGNKTVTNLPPTYVTAGKLVCRWVTILIRWLDGG